MSLKNQKSRSVRFCIFFSATLFSSVSAFSADEIISTAKEQKSVAVTIYNQNMALIKDKRRIAVPQGRRSLAFREVSANMQPETALLTADNLGVVEQNFEFDLLTPQSLLQKYVGKDVEVVRTHPTTGEETRKKAKVLSSNSGVVLEMQDHIEMGMPGRLIFPDVPDDLRDKPTLTMLVDSSTNSQQDVELTYLSSGLGWKADYVAELNHDDTKADITGWVTLTNTSGATYQNAMLQLVAGDVNRAKPERMADQMVGMKAAMPAAPARESMAEESMFEYHLYTLGRPTTIKDNQTKQISLLQASDVPCRKEYRLKGNDYYYRSHYGELGQAMKVGVFMEIKNTKANNMGMPAPKGVVRVYKKDSKGNIQFVGEDRIDHTPENETIRLKLGDAFDITADKKQTAFVKKEGFSPYNYVYEASFQVDIKNAKPEKVTVNVIEPVPGDWEVLKQSHQHIKDAANTATWAIEVPPKGKSTLTYTARVRF